MKKLNLDFLIFLILFSILFGCAQESKETDVFAHRHAEYFMKLAGELSVTRTTRQH